VLRHVILSFTKNHFISNYKVPMAEFATTRWSLVYAARLDDAAAASNALGQLCEIYRPAVFAYVHRCLRNRTDAEDLTQSFFVHLLSKRIDAAADPDRGRFRVYLRVAITNFLRNHFDYLNAQRRSAGADTIEWLNTEPTPEAAFETAWTLTVLQRALMELASETEQAGKAALFAEIKPFLLDPAEKGDYDAVAERLGVRINTIAVSVHRLRQRLREIVRSIVTDTVIEPSDINSELQLLRRAPKAASADEHGRNA
jgi:RNA polymerase sigma factor (sigma-70 family)